MRISKRLLANQGVWWIMKEMLIKPVLRHPLNTDPRQVVYTIARESLRSGACLASLKVLGGDREGSDQMFPRLIETYLKRFGK